MPYFLVVVVGEGRVDCATTRIQFGWHTLLRGGSSRAVVYLTRYDGMGADKIIVMLLEQLSSLSIVLFFLLSGGGSDKAYRY